MTALTLPRPGFSNPAITTALLAAVLALILFTIARGMLIGDVERLLRMPVAVMIHVVTVVPAIPLTIYMLNAQPGTRTHRIAGYVWSTLMVTTAIAGFLIEPLGQFNPIQIFSVLTLAGVPRAIYYARNHRIAEHRKILNSLIFGGLIVAGLTAYLPGRLMFHWITG